MRFQVCKTTAMELNYLKSTSPDGVSVSDLRSIAERCVGTSRLQADYTVRSEILTIADWLERNPGGTFSYSWTSRS